LAFHPYPQLIRGILKFHRFGLSHCFTNASTWSRVDHHRFGCACCDDAFLDSLSLCVLRMDYAATTDNSQTHYAKGRPSPTRGFDTLNACGLVTAFPSPATASAFADSIPGSMVPACSFALSLPGSCARSAFQLHRRNRLAPIPAISLPHARCVSTGQLIRLLSPSPLPSRSFLLLRDQSVQWALPPSGSSSESTRSSLAPRQPFYC